MKLIDAIGLGLIIVGIMMTAVNFFTARGPNSRPQKQYLMGGADYVV